MPIIVPLALHKNCARLCAEVRQFMMMRPSAGLTRNAMEHSLAPVKLRPACQLAPKSCDQYRKLGLPWAAK